MVECGGLENRYGASHRGFESLPLRQLGIHGTHLMALQEKATPKADAKAAPKADSNAAPKGGEDAAPKADANSAPKAVETSTPASGANTATPPSQPEQPATDQGMKSGDLGKAGTTNTTGQQADGGTAQDTLAGGDSGMWTYIWLGLLLAFILFLWRRGHLARLKKHVGETREQLKKCTWPTREELKQHTVVVLLSTLLLGLFIVVSDVVVQYIVWDVLPTLVQTDTE